MVASLVPAYARGVAHVHVITDDLLFGSRLQGDLGAAGHEVTLGVAADPVEAFRAGGYAEKLANERGTASVESAYERL